MQALDFYGRSGGIRTRDPLLPKQMRYQAALRSDKDCYCSPFFPRVDLALDFRIPSLALVVFIIHVLLASIEPLSKEYSFRGQGQYGDTVKSTDKFTVCSGAL